MMKVLRTTVEMRIILFKLKMVSTLVYSTCMIIAICSLELIPFYLRKFYFQFILLKKELT